MSALEVIEQIKALPPEEKAAVVDFVRHIEAPSEQTVADNSVHRRALEASAEKIFDRYDDLFRKLAK